MLRTTMSADAEDESDLLPGPDLHAGMFRERTIREVLDVRSELQGHQVAASPSAAAADAILESLERLTDYCLDRDIIARTAIGKEVGALKKHADSGVAQKAEALVAEWKSDMAIRDRVVEGFMEKGSLKKRYAKELEEGLFNAACPLGLLAGEGYRSYQKHYKRLCTHLRDRGPGSLVERLGTRLVELSQAAWLPDDSLRSQEKQLQLVRAQAEGLKAAVVAEEVKGTISEEYVCPACGSTKTAYQEMQTGWHSDHQDLTIIVQCISCGNRWKAADDHGFGGS